MFLAHARQFGSYFQELDCKESRHSFRLSDVTVSIPVFFSLDASMWLVQIQNSILEQ
jgi:hypothetical protein